MRGVEHEDITKYEKYHGYQDYVIEQREKNVSELRLKLREKEQEIDRLKNEITKLSNHINYLEYHRGIPKKKQKYNHKDTTSNYYLCDNISVSNVLTCKNNGIMRDSLNQGVQGSNP